MMQTVVARLFFSHRHTLATRICLVDEIIIDDFFLGRSMMLRMNSNPERSLVMLTRRIM